MAKDLIRGFAFSPSRRLIVISIKRENLESLLERGFQHVDCLMLMRNNCKCCVWLA